MKNNSKQSKNDSDTPDQKYRKWIFCADQMYFGSRSSFVNGYNIPAIISANYAVEFYLKTSMTYLGIECWIQPANAKLGLLIN